MDFLQSGFSSLQNQVRDSLNISEKRNIIASMIAGLFVSIKNKLFVN